MSLTAPPIPSHLNPSTSPQRTPQVGGSPKSSRSRTSPASSPQHTSPGSPRGGLAGMLDVEVLLKFHSGDLRKALDSVVAERNSLQSQNTQLWKLIEKQRSQSAHLTTDNDRLRHDRERANSRLLAAGLEPVIPIVKQKLPSSNSAVGLGFRAEGNQLPVIRRHNSDRDNIASATPPSLHIFGPSSPSSAPASPIREVPPPNPSINRSLGSETTNGLLPSPMAERRLRHESRMVFPPEVSSFMSLADEPDHAAPAMRASTSNSTLILSSQYSQSPEVTVPPRMSSVVPPQSSRALSITTEMPDLEAASQRGPPSPLPTRSSSVSSYRTNDAPPPDYAKTPQEPVPPFPTVSSPRASEDSQTPRGSLDPRGSTDTRSTVNKDQGALLPRLTLQLLPHARIVIPSSLVYQNQSGRDVLCFIISITVRPPNAQPITWNVAKLFSAFIDLDTRIKAKSGKSSREWKKTVIPLPEGRTWKDFAPSKIDQRKTTLESYLHSLLVAPISDKSDLCHFLSTDPVQPKSREGRKEGYLTKKGKNFGGWKTRFFVLDGPQMEYYETRGGPHLGSIIITNAQIGRQNRPSESNDDREFRHAFLIIETPKKGTTNRHVLCAESDQERDSWIEMLVRYVDPEQAAKSQPPPQSSASQNHGSTPTDLKRKISIRKLSKDVVVTAAQPIASMPDAGSKLYGAPSPSLFNSMESQKVAEAQAQAQSQARSDAHVKSNDSVSLNIPGQHPKPGNASGPTNATAESPTQSVKAPTSTLRSSPPPQQPNYPTTLVTSPSETSLSSSPPMSITSEPGSSARGAKRQSVMPLPTRQSFSPAYLSKLSQDGLSAPQGYPASEKDRDRKAKSGRFWSPFSTKAPEKLLRPVFGVSLNESIAIATVANLPAIVYRCIEFLEAKKAEDEEGIYRLSGSSAVIKGLKDRFNLEGDVNLLQLNENLDPHAIAGLLKTFLRDLPASLLTHELHISFLSVMDLVESSARVKELSRLVSELPPPNYALLRALTAHLILVVKNASVNKMTLRNIGIVFSPTLGIPAGIFSELVSHFGRIFDDDPEELDDDEAEGHDRHVGVLDAVMGGHGDRDNDVNGLEVLGDGHDGEETIKRKRNSILYQAGGIDAMLGLGGRSLDLAPEDSASELSMEDGELDLDMDGVSEGPSSNSTDNLSTASTSNIRAHLDTPPESATRSDLAIIYPSAAVVRKAKAAAAAAERGLGVQTSPLPSSLSAGNGNGDTVHGNGTESGASSGSGMTLVPGSGVGSGARSPGLPLSPRPGMNESLGEVQSQAQALAQTRAPAHVEGVGE